MFKTQSKTKHQLNTLLCIGIASFILASCDNVGQLSPKLPSQDTAPDSQSKVTEKDPLAESSKQPSETQYPDGTHRAPPPSAEAPTEDTTGESNLDEEGDSITDTETEDEPEETISETEPENEPETEPQTYNVSVTVSGLSGTLNLRLNDSETKSIEANGIMNFETTLGTGTSYSVTIQDMPELQECVVSSGSGTVGITHVIDIEVACSAIPQGDFAVTSPTGIVSAHRPIVRWNGLSGAEKYEVSVANAATCLPETIIQTKADISWLDRSVQLDWLAKGDYYLCLSALRESVVEKASETGIAFTVGELVLGQPNFTSNSSDLGNNVSLSYPSSFRCSHGKCFATEGFKVMIWNSRPNAINQAADLVLGDPEGNTWLTSTTFGWAEDAWYDGSRFIVYDNSNARILSWNGFPTSANDPADFVWGAPDFETEGEVLSTMSAFLGFIGNRFLIGDYNRILGFDNFPTTSNQTANFVLGQNSFDTNTSGLGASGLYWVGQMAWDGEHFFAADYSNNRVLIWNGIPASNAEPADLVLGQPTLDTDLVNNSGLSARSLSGPWGVATYDGKLYVSDYGNNRVLVWNNIPQSNFAPADRVIGQPNFTSGLSNNGDSTPTSNSLKNPYGLHVDENGIYISDYSNKRILVKMLDELPAEDQ